MLFIYPFFTALTRKAALICSKQNAPVSSRAVSAWYLSYCMPVNKFRNFFKNLFLSIFKQLFYIVPEECTVQCHKLAGRKSQVTPIQLFHKMLCSSELYDNLKQVYCLYQLGLKFPKALEWLSSLACHHWQSYCIIPWHILCIMQVILNHCMKI